MHLLPERLIEWKVAGGWTAAQARRTTHDHVHACRGGWFTSAWWLVEFESGRLAALATTGRAPGHKDKDKEWPKPQWRTQTRQGLSSVRSKQAPATPRDVAWTPATILKFLRGRPPSS